MDYDAAAVDVEDELDVDELEVLLEESEDDELEDELEESEEAATDVLDEPDRLSVR